MDFQHTTVDIAFNMFAEKALSEQHILLDLTTDDPFYSSKHMAMLEERVADIKAGRNVSEHELIEVEEEE